MVEVVTLSEKKYRKNGKEYVSYTVSIPRKIIEELKWEKGDKLVAKVIEYEGRKAIIYYKLEE